MSYLEYQDEMYHNAMTDDDCLVIASRGIGLEQLMVRLCRTYSDETSLVLVIGTNTDDETFIINQLVDEKEIPYGKLPQSITAETSNTKKRTEIYLSGGVLFVTERILVLDLLTKRVPLEHVTGILVYRAHKVHSDCLMSFILRLYRTDNKKGFIKALSQDPQSFFGDFGKLDKIMRKLFVTSLHLWPRFHASIQASLAPPRAQPMTIELDLPMTARMRTIHTDILQLIDMCLKELKKTNITVLQDTDDLTIDNALSKSFHKSLKSRFDSVWHQLSSHARRLIEDIQWLSNMLRLLTQTDVVTFYNHTRAAQNSIRLGREVSDWITWKPASSLFKLSKERLYPNNTKMGEEELEAETNLKWKSFQETINEIDRETAALNDTIDVFIIVASDSTARLLERVLMKGATQVLKERIHMFNSILKADSRSADGMALLGLQDEEDECSNDAANLNVEPPTKKRPKVSNSSDNLAAGKVNTLTQIVRRMNENDDQVVTIDDDDDDDESNEKDCEAAKTSDKVPDPVNVVPMRKRHQLKLRYFVTYRQERVLFESMLRDHRPMHFIVYDHDVHALRQIEIYQALYCHPKRCKVYIIRYAGSSEHMEFMYSLRREKEAFENLIKEKASMVVPRGRDGRTDGHPDLVRGNLKANETTDSVNTRRAGGQIERSEIIKQKILVDTREFRCLLPSIIHKRGIEIEPFQLTIGDYILSSDTCVERKSVSDLIQSLQSGRLHNQANMMTRHFKRSILLIEFDENKSFHFKGRYWGGYGGYTGPRKMDGAVDLIDKLILLTIHHPNLRIVWSPSTHFTAELFEYLKSERDQPDPVKIAAISAQELPAESFEDQYDIQVKDFLLKLPGVNTGNVYSIMNAAPTLADLVNISVEELHELLGNSRSAELFHKATHGSLRSMANEAIRAEQASKKSRLFSCTNRRKGLS